MNFIIDHEQEIEIVHSSDNSTDVANGSDTPISDNTTLTPPTPLSISPSIDLVHNTPSLPLPPSPGPHRSPSFSSKVSREMPPAKPFPLSATVSSSTASSTVSSTMDKVRVNFSRKRSNESYMSGIFRSTHGTGNHGGKQSAPETTESDKIEKKEVSAFGFKLGKHGTNTKTSPKPQNDSDNDEVFDENSVSDDGHTHECSRRLVEYFVVVSSVPRVLPSKRKLDPDEVHDSCVGAKSVSGSVDNNVRQNSDARQRKGGEDPPGREPLHQNGSLEPSGNHLLRPRLSRAQTDQTSNTQKSLLRPRPPERDFSADRMNPRTFARFESRRVHMQQQYGGSGGNAGGSAAAAIDTAAELHDLDSITDVESSPNDALINGTGRVETPDSGMSFGHSPRFGFGNDVHITKGSSETASSSCAEESSCARPPSPIHSPPVSSSEVSSVTQKPPPSKEKTNNFFKSMNERSMKMGLKGEFQNLEKKLSMNTAGFQQFEKKLAKDTAEGLQNLEKKLKSMKFLRPPPNGLHGDKGCDDASLSSCSTFSDNDDTPTKNVRVAFGDSSGGASAFQPSKTPTSARTPFISQTPPSPHASSFPDVDDSAFPISTGGATENIRFGHEFDFRRKEYNDDIDDCILEPIITAQYPSVEHPDQPLTPMLPHFCYPQGTDFIVPLHEYKMPTVHHFVLTDSKGSKLYGTCLTVYEEFCPDHKENEGIDDNISLPSMREEHQERGYVECTIDGSPKVVRPRRRSKNHTYYAPRVLCLLSTWPYLTAFRTYLTQLYRLATTTTLMTAPLERYILNICSEVPAPPPGAFEVQLSILGTNIRFWAPPADQPVPYVSLPYEVLFECLDIGNVLFAWYTLACERKILLVSGQLSLLTVCAEILCSMLFPMRWTHLYIPVLPRMLTPMLDAPMPYLCGISRDIFPFAVGDISDETVVVDLDRNVITMGQQTPDLPILPQRRKMKLEAALEKHAGEVFWKARGLTKEIVEHARASGDEDELAKLLGTADAVWDEKICMMDEAFDLAYAPGSMSLKHDADGGTLEKQSRWDAVQEAFLRFYVSMLKDYRKYLPAETSERRLSWRGSQNSDENRFQVAEFLQDQRPEFQPFLEELVGTQQFDDFITRRIYNAGNAPDVTFFDQSIDAKLNRYKLKLKKVETPFLNSANAHRDLKCIDAIEPNNENVPSYAVGKDGSYTYPTWPESFDVSLFGKPRPIPSIISNEFDRRSALAAMLRAKRGIAAEERQPGSSNASPESTSFVIFFITFSQLIGKDLIALEERNYVMNVNLLDEEHEVSPAGSSINRVNSSSSDGVWKPKINPPWMAGENFQSLHKYFDPEETVEDDTNKVAPSNGVCAPNNLCEDCDLGKAIEASTFMGFPWSTRINAPNETGSQSEPTSKPDFESPVSDELEIELEKARAIARAQVDLGFNALKMMHMRKLPPESITYKTLIEACGRSGISHRATQIMEMMSLDGLAADSEMYFCFVKAFSNADSEASISYQPSSGSFSDVASFFRSGAETMTPGNTSSHNDEVPSGSGHVRHDVMKGVNGLYKDLSSSVSANKRTFKMSKMKNVSSFFKKGLTKRKHLLVTNAIQAQLDLGHCILEDLYPGIKIDADSDACPKCSCVLGQDNIIMGWKPCDVKDYSTTCPSCKHRFVPKFSVSCNLESFEGSQGKGTPLYLDYLSPWVLLRAIKSIFTPSSTMNGKAAKILGVDNNSPTDENGSIDTIIDPAFREGTGINATLWWNMIVTFIRFKIPFTYLLQGSFQNELIVPTLDDM